MGDIADIYYPAFLTNGKALAEYPEFKTGEKVRLRFINASASTYYWMDFGGGNPMVVSGDGIDVEPVAKSRFLFGIAETYDVIVTIPEGTLEVTATAQDGSGHTSIQLGNGTLYPAKIIDRPDKIEMMKQMAKMDMKMDMKDGQMKMGMHDNMSMKDSKMSNQMKMDDTMEMKKDSMQMNQIGDSDKMKDHMQHNMSKMQKDTSSFDYEERKTYFNYDFLEAKEKT